MAPTQKTQAEKDAEAKAQQEQQQREEQAKAALKPAQTQTPVATPSNAPQVVIVTKPEDVKSEEQKTQENAAALAKMHEEASIEGTVGVAERMALEQVNPALQERSGKKVYRVGIGRVQDSVEGEIIDISKLYLGPDEDKEAHFQRLLNLGAIVEDTSDKPRVFVPSENPFSAPMQIIRQTPAPALTTGAPPSLLLTEEKVAALEAASSLSGGQSVAGTTAASDRPVSRPAGPSEV